LVELIKKDVDFEVRKKAISKIHDRGLLEQLLVDVEDHYILRKIKNKLSELE